MIWERMYDYSLDPAALKMSRDELDERETADMTREQRIRFWEWRRQFPDA